MFGPPGSDPTWKPNPPPTNHESSNGSVPDYGTLVDITGLAKSLMFNGDNVLAIGGYRDYPDTDDLVLVPYVSVNQQGVDNCPGDFNPEQEDLDGDDIGDICDTDIDGDGVLNGPDNCPLIDNNQDNNDGDTFGDACDVCPDDADNDIDDDGICVGSGFAPPKIGDMDNCPLVYNPPSDCDDNIGTPDEQCDFNTDGEGDA